MIYSRGVFLTDLFFMKNFHFYKRKTIHKAYCNAKIFSITIRYAYSLRCVFSRAEINLVKNTHSSSMLYRVDLLLGSTRFMTWNDVPDRCRNAYLRSLLSRLFFSAYYRGRMFIATSQKGVLYIYTSTAFFRNHNLRLLSVIVAPFYIVRPQLLVIPEVLKEISIGSH